MQIFVDIQNDENTTITLDVNDTDKIEFIKEKISEETGISADLLTICYDGNDLDNEWTLQDCNISDESTLTAIIAEDNAEPTDPVEEDIPVEQTHRQKILRNAYIKLDSLPLSFGLPAYSDDMDDDQIERYLKTDIADTLRETRLKIENIEEDSVDEMQIENRIVYHAIKRFRLTASAFFKFSTATDGKTVDKTQVPKMLAEILKDYEDEYKKWQLHSTGSLWNREGTVRTTTES